MREEYLRGTAHAGTEKPATLCSVAGQSRSRVLGDGMFLLLGYVVLLVRGFRLLDFAAIFWAFAASWFRSMRRRASLQMSAVPQTSIMKLSPTCSVSKDDDAPIDEKALRMNRSSTRPSAFGRQAKSNALSLRPS
jgi:hypothetical protein